MDEFRHVKFNPENYPQVVDWYNTPLERRITLVLPVNKANDAINKTITEYVSKKDLKEYAFYNPQIHTYQIDPTGGLTICKQRNII